MQNENIMESKPDKASQAEKTSQPNVKDALQNLLENTELRADSLRQIIDGGLLGICLTFFFVMLGMQRNLIDATLTRALYTFAIAIPLLICGFALASYKVVRFAHSSEMLTLVFAMQAARIIEIFGWLAVAVGVFFIIWHLSVFAAVLFLFSIVACLTLLIILSFIIAIPHRAEWMASTNRKEQKQADSTTPDRQKQPTRPEQQSEA